MQPIQKALRKSLILCVILTLCLPLGGAMMGVGFAFSQPAVWGPGIGLLAVGFYGTPIGWTTAYAPKKALHRIVSAVMEEHLHTVNEIAVQLSMSEKDVRVRAQKRAAAHRDRRHGGTSAHGERDRRAAFHVRKGRPQ